MGMARMLEVLKMDLIGKHHSGIDDCRNIARLLIRMMHEGCVFQLTTDKEAKQAVAQPKEETPAEDVREFLSAAQKISTKEWLHNMKKNANVSDQDLNDNKKAAAQFQGLLVKAILDQLKAEHPEAASLSSAARKNLAQSITNHVKSLLE